jgi:hypothetical protein
MRKIDVCPDKDQSESDAEYDITVRRGFFDYNPSADADVVSMTSTTLLRRHLRDTFAPTVGFREYVQFGGSDEEALFHIAVAAEGMTVEERAILARAALAFTYSGKRGCFLRFAPVGTADGLMDAEELPETAPYTLPCSILRLTGGSIRLGTIQPLDELSTAARWNSVNTYGTGQVYAAREGMTCTVRNKHIEPDRVFVESFVPYRLAGCARGYSYFQRSDAA